MLKRARGVTGTYHFRGESRTDRERARVQVKEGIIEEYISVLFYVRKVKSVGAMKSGKPCTRDPIYSSRRSEALVRGDVVDFFSTEYLQ